MFTMVAKTLLASLLSGVMVSGYNPTQGVEEVIVDSQSVEDVLHTGRVLEQAMMLPVPVFSFFDVAYGEAMKQRNAIVAQQKIEREAKAKSAREKAKAKAAAESRKRSEKAKREATKMASDPVAKYGSTCDEIILKYRPIQVPKSVKFKCVSNLGHSGTTTAPIANGAYYHTPTEVLINRNRTPGVIRAAIVHESAHVVSFSWSENKQARYLKSQGYSSWQEGSYWNHPAERWANQAVRCLGEEPFCSMERFQGWLCYLSEMDE